MFITYNHDIDWIVKVALDVGMEIVKICIMEQTQDEGFRTELEDIASILVEESYDRRKSKADVLKYKPDLVIANYQSEELLSLALGDVIPFCPDVGFFSGVIMAEKWVDLFGLNNEGEWKNDKRLFDKYYSR